MRVVNGGVDRRRSDHVRRLPRLLAAALLLGSAAAPASFATEHQSMTPATCQVLRTNAGPIRSPAFATLDDELRRGVGDLYAGAVLMVAYQGQVIHAAAFGNAQTLATTPDGALRPLDRPRPMTIDSVFDMASVTKVESTTVAIMQLVGAGQLHLDDTLGALLPEFAGTDKAPITVRQLLTHRAGLWEWQPTWMHSAAGGPALPYLVALPLRYPTGSRFAYSDIGFMLLGEIVARVSGKPLDHYVSEKIYAPLGMTDTGYLPDAARRGRAVATSHGDDYQRLMVETGKPYPAAPFPPAPPFSAYRNRMLVGEANDANAWLGWDGVAGHAGLFSTALDLSRLSQALVNGGCYGDWRLAPSETVAAFEQTPSDPNQALGFHKSGVPGEASPFYGHAGFTGTWFAFSPQLGLSVVLLANRVHRDESDNAGYPSLTGIREAALAQSVAAVTGRPAPATDGSAARP